MTQTILTKVFEIADSCISKKIKKLPEIWKRFKMKLSVGSDQNSYLEERNRKKIIDNSDLSKSSVFGNIQSEKR